MIENNAPCAVFEEREGTVQLVMTTWMLLDRLVDCHEIAQALRDEAQRRGVGEISLGAPVNPLAVNAST